MKMPEKIEAEMFAPCGMNCMVCYKHVGTRKSGKPCESCLKGDLGKPEQCRKCKIKSCAQEKGYTHCFECTDFPCILIKNFEKSYQKRYETSLVENSKAAQEKGVDAFLEQDRLKWLCSKCGGAFSLHDGICSDCNMLNTNQQNKHKSY
ncbi:MAG: DUF3795 domain-containing protein [Suipraeoptans sp.]